MSKRRENIKKMKQLMEELKSKPKKKVEKKANRYYKEASKVEEEPTADFDKSEEKKSE